MKTVKMIAGVSQNGVIGISDENGKGTIPWRHKADMKRFKELTTNHTVIMGRLTYESMGRLLPNRRNIVVTGNVYEGVETAKSLKEAIDKSEGLVWLIGGAGIYREGMAFVDEIDITIVPETINNPTAIYFPWINPRAFNAASIVMDADSGLTHVLYRR